MDKIDILFKEYNVTKSEQKQIMDVFDMIRQKNIGVNKALCGCQK